MKKCARALAALVLLSLAMAASASAQAWSLSLQQRKNYLAYYSPILMLRANEKDADHYGYSWMTNFDFDRDGNFSTNKSNWEKIDDFVRGYSSQSTWTVRPTLYTAMMEFMETNGTKSVIMLYHVYHGKQENSIHDWERIEIRVNSVNGTPGSGSEQVRYVVVTRHSKHPYRLLGSGDLNFQTTSTGKHVMIWQAQWNLDETELCCDTDGPPHMQELRFVEDSFSNVSSRVTSNADAEVNVPDTGERKNVHYVFACDCSSGAVNYWQAQTLGFANASSLAAKKFYQDDIKWSNVKRIKYELQDIADIFETHWEFGGYATHWAGSPKSIFLESPITNESGQTVVSTGLQRFYRQSKTFQQEGNDVNRNGYPNKNWIWGAYDFGGVDNVRYFMWSGLSPQPNRATASGRPDSLGSYWWQHDYFAHDGGNSSVESGRWLPGNWYTPAGGGWDGRWVQIFTD